MFKTYLDSKKDSIEENIGQVPTSKIHSTNLIDEIEEMEEEQKSESDT
jgi:hypothetical protein